MAVPMQTLQRRQATPDRWQRALQRALFAGVEAKQLAGTGQWIVASASRPGIAYRTDGVSCDCEAAMLGGDPVCLHRAAYWYAQGVLELDPEPDPPAPVAPVSCFACNGCGQQWYRGGFALPCPTCQGSGMAPLVAKATALVADAFGESCDRCGRPLGADAEMDEALHTLCDDCLAVVADEAGQASQAAISAAHRHHLTERAAA